jgi:hypothetical protein
VASIFFLHLMINVGMAIGLAPVIGIPAAVLQLRRQLADRLHVAAEHTWCGWMRSALRSCTEGMVLSCSDIRAEAPLHRNLEHRCAHPRTSRSSSKEYRNCLPPPGAIS